MIMTITEMVARVRSNVDEPIENIAKDTEITAWLTSGMDVLLQAIKVQAGDISIGGIQPLDVLPDVAEYSLASYSLMDIVVAVKDAAGESIPIIADPSLHGAFFWMNAVSFNPVPQKAEVYKIYYLGGVSSHVRKTVAECVVEYACVEYFRKDRDANMVSLCKGNYRELEQRLVAEVFASQPVRQVANVQGDTWDSYYLSI